jgi:hypothetical protein
MLYWTPLANFLCREDDIAWWLGGRETTVVLFGEPSPLLANRFIAENILVWHLLTCPYAQRKVARVCRRKKSIMTLMRVGMLGECVARKSDYVLILFYRKLNRK